jgi:hypothetical protein
MSISQSERGPPGRSKCRSKRRSAKFEILIGPTAHNIASTLIGVADRYFGPDHADRELIAELRRLRKCLGARATGLTKKNRRLLLELSDPQLRAKLYELPDRLAAWAVRTTPAQGARAMQLAVAIAILLIGSPGQSGPSLAREFGEPTQQPGTECLDIFCHPQATKT